MEEENFDYTEDEYESSEIIIENSANEDSKTLMKGYNKKKNSIKKQSKPKTNKVCDAGHAPQYRRG